MQSLLTLIVPTLIAVSRASPSPLNHTRAAEIACEDLTAPEIDNATVIDFTTNELILNGTKVCDANVYITHPGAGDRVRFQHYLPLEAWNGRYMGKGGSGLRAGIFDDNLDQAARDGFVAGATDAGLPANSSDGSLWAGDEQLITNFAHLSVHEMTLVGKALAETFYGSPVQRAYWDGCSTGGRQGYMEAQQYPRDYDGIFAGAPAINYARFRIAQLYPYILQSEHGFPPQCVWRAFEDAAMAACDGLDGAEDGIISHPPDCLDVFDPARLVDQTLTGCAEGNGTVTLSEYHVELWRNMTMGPLFPDGTPAFQGIAPGTRFSTLTRTTPVSISSTWVRDFVVRDTDFDIGSIRPGEAHEVMALSDGMYGHIIGTDDPDLSDFRDAGGKLLSWHGWSDELIFAAGTVEYRRRVEGGMGGPGAVDEFYRLFMAPGVELCGGGIGAEPSEGMAQLINWVERGEAPEVLRAESGSGVTRNLCLFPRKMVYSGEGDVDAAESWVCT